MNTLKCSGMQITRRLLPSLYLLSLSALAGEIPGLPTPTLPNIPREAIVTLGNDLLAGGSTILDDSRTQQLMLETKLGDRWELALDHSILTYEAEGFELDWGRLDQLSGSLGYRLLQADESSGGLNFMVGAGFRSYGKYGGAEIQNGFHRLIGDRIFDLPYVETNREDLTLWLRGETHGDMPWDSLRNLFGEKGQVGYWVHATALATHDGQWDVTTAAHLTFSRAWFNAWLGLRADWREGYDRDLIQIATADSEETTYGVFGMRIGPLLLETQQSFESDKGFGRVSLIADINPTSRHRQPGLEYSLTAGVSVPEVNAVLQGRREFCGWLRCDDRRRWRLVGELRYGEPSINELTDRYVEVLQLGAGLELEQSFDAWPDWLSTYGWLGAGWREEQVRGDEFRTGQDSDSEDTAVLLGEIGFRATTVAVSERWALRLQAGLSGWLPAGDERVAFAGDTEELLSPGLGVLFSAAIEFRP